MEIQYQKYLGDLESSDSYLYYAKSRQMHNQLIISQWSDLTTSLTKTIKKDERISRIQEHFKISYYSLKISTRNNNEWGISMKLFILTVFNNVISTLWALIWKYLVAKALKWISISYITFGKSFKLWVSVSSSIKLGQQYQLCIPPKIATSWKKSYERFHHYYAYENGRFSYLLKG